jgi:hypothetical protein
VTLEHAPIYVRAYDLCVYVTARAVAAGRHEHLLHAATLGAQELLSGVALALTFPERRATHLIHADEWVVRVRLSLRLARACGVLAPASARHAHTLLDAVGRMIGGWRRKAAPRLSTRTGDGPQAAARVSSAAAATGTTPTGAAPPTATGTSPTTPGTTTASGSACLPPNPRAGRKTRQQDNPARSNVDKVLASGMGLYDAPYARTWARMDDDWPPRGRGLPMGAVTSQLFATHLFLQAFDHWVKRRLGVHAYVRYVDDIFVFGDSRSTMRAWRAAIAAYLSSELDLRLKHPQARVLSCRGHVDALGVRLRRGLIEPLPAAMRRLRGRLGAYVRGMGRVRDRTALQRSVASSAGNLLFG